jgi:hypothetical protein
MFGGILSLRIATITDGWSHSNGYAPAYRGEGWRRAWACKRSDSASNWLITCNTIAQGRGIDTGIIGLRFELQRIHDQETASPLMSPSCAMPGSLLLVAALALPGCWSAPIATLQSKGNPHLIQGAIAVPVESVKPLAVVQSVDLAARAITVQRPGEARLISYKVGLSASNLERLKAGDRVQATVAEELTVYVRRDGDLPSVGGSPHTVVTDAQVLSVDPSYRLVALHFPDGHTEMFKASLRVKLDKMETGDEVTIRRVEAVALRIKN